LWYTLSIPGTIQAQQTDPADDAQTDGRLVHEDILMARTHFSGPVTTGTTREGPSANWGYTVASQSFDTGDLTGATVGNLDGVGFRLPAGSQILDIVVDQVEAAAGSTTTISVGTASGGAQLMAGVATTAGGRFRGTATAATQLAWQDVGGDVFVRVAVGGTLTAGRAIVTVLYAQK